eukprot:354461-Chlamydomonas_euryale.AAC.1
MRLRQTSWRTTARKSRPSTSSRQSRSREVMVSYRTCYVYCLSGAWQTLAIAAGPTLLSSALACFDAGTPSHF